MPSISFQLSWSVVLPRVHKVDWVLLQTRNMLPIVLDLILTSLKAHSPSYADINFGELQDGKIRSSMKLSWPAMPTQGAIL